MLKRRPVLTGLSCLALILAGCGSTEPSVTTSTTSAISSTAATTPSTPPSSPPTPPTEGAIEPVDTALLVIGDWGSGTLPQGAVAGAMQRSAQSLDVEAILTTGDNFYSDDADFLMQPFGWATDEGIPFWIAWGNHDIETDERIEAVNETFDDPPRWAIYEWGEIDVIVLDSNQITNVAQGAFFLAAMADSSNPTIVVFHHPVYSCSHHGPTIEVANTLVENLDDDVVLVLNGHEHSYQRFENGEISFVVTGGGGRHLRPLSDCDPEHPERLAGAELHHFLSMTQTASHIVLEAIDVNGDLIERVEVPFR